MKLMTCDEHNRLNESILGLCDMAVERGITALQKETNGPHRDVVKSPALAAYITGFVALLVHATTEDK